MDFPSFLIGVTGTLIAFFTLMAMIPKYGVREWIKDIGQVTISFFKELFGSFIRLIKSIVSKSGDVWVNFRTFISRLSEAILGAFIFISGYLLIASAISIIFFAPQAIRSGLEPRDIITDFNNQPANVQDDIIGMLITLVFLGFLVLFILSIRSFVVNGKVKKLNERIDYYERLPYIVKMKQHYNLLLLNKTRDKWAEFIEHLEKEQPSIASDLSTCFPFDVHDEILTVVCSSQSLCNRLNNQYQTGKYSYLYPMRVQKELRSFFEKPDTIKCKVIRAEELYHLKQSHVQPNKNKP